MVRITAAAFLAFVAISSAAFSGVSEGMRVAARADEPVAAAGETAATTEEPAAAPGDSVATPEKPAAPEEPLSAPEDLKKLDTLIDAVGTLSDLLKGLKQGGGETAQGAGEQKEVAA
ncbi:hypothetical protein A9K55_000252 [Cordyceps militaris]|uniref:Uncharacterized protein n=1 Tax=Cordyceps militaris TaxID=73501 RepID=A0A2H4SVY8_CORMI|nr:hypothetical protein A9K55_000252 [Cordyceps militaris]